jgi:hypothetical protein
MIPHTGPGRSQVHNRKQVLHSTMCSKFPLKKAASTTLCLLWRLAGATPNNSRLGTGTGGSVGLCALRGRRPGYLANATATGYYTGKAGASTASFWPLQSASKGPVVVVCLPMAIIPLGKGGSIPDPQNPHGPLSELIIFYFKRVSCSLQQMLWLPPWVFRHQI